MYTNAWSLHLVTDEIMCALESRAWDKDALEFVRQQKKKKS